MLSISTMPIIGGISLGIKTVLEAIGYYFKKPALLLFFIYASIINAVLSGLGLAIVKLICWLDRSNEPSVWCKIIKFDVTKIIDFDRQYFFQHQNQIQNKDMLIGIFILGLFVTIGICTIYVSYYAMVGLARYIELNEDEGIASPTKALSIEPQKKRRLWQWSFIIFILIFLIRYVVSRLFDILSPAYQIKFYSWGIVPATTALLMLILFYAIPYLAYKNHSAWKTLKKQFVALMKTPSATLTSWLLLSCLLFYIPSLLTENHLIKIFGQAIHVIAMLITPVTQILLFRRLKHLL